MLEGIIEQLRSQTKEQTMHLNSTYTQGSLKMTTEQTPEFRGQRGVFDQEFQVIRDLMIETGTKTENDLWREVTLLVKRAKANDRTAKLENNLKRLLIDFDQAKYSWSKPRTKDIWRWVKSLAVSHMQNRNDGGSYEEKEYRTIDQTSSQPALLKQRWVL